MLEDFTAVSRQGAFPKVFAEKYEAKEAVINFLWSYEERRSNSGSKFIPSGSGAYISCTVRVDGSVAVSRRP